MPTWMLLTKTLEMEGEINGTCRRKFQYRRGYGALRSHSCKRFLCGKPIRWGYKLWVGAKGLGYVGPYQCPLTTNKDFKKTDRGSFEYKSSLPENILVCKWMTTVSLLLAQMLRLWSLCIKSRGCHKNIRNNMCNMGGVDRSDQNIGLYRTSICGMKWYFCLFCHSLDMAVHNAWQLYKRDGGEYDHLTYRRSLAKGLLKTYKKSDRRRPFPTPMSHPESSRYDGVDHLVQYSAAQLRCKVFKVTRFFICQKCKIHLQPKNCFMAYHSQTQ